MTRKDYEALAAALASNKPGEMYPNKPMTTWLAIIHSVADVFQKDNPRFDRVRFFAACDVEVAP